MPRSSGSGSLTHALVAYLRSLGGEIVTGAPVASLDELPAAQAVLLDLTARQILRLDGTQLPARYCAQLERFQYGLATDPVRDAQSEALRLLILDAPWGWRPRDGWVLRSPARTASPISTRSLAWPTKCSGRLPHDPATRPPQRPG